MDKSELSELLQRVDMLSFVKSLGYNQCVKNKSTRLWNVWENRTLGARVIIPPSNDKAQILGVNLAMRNPINFYIDSRARCEVYHPDRQQYKEAIEYIKHFVGTGIIDAYVVSRSVAPVVPEKKSETDLRKIHNYIPINFDNPKHTPYFEKRNLVLDNAFIDKFKNDIFISEKVVNSYKFYNPTFLKVDTFGEISGLVKRYFDRDGQSKKYVDGTGFWHSHIDENTTYKGIVVVESQIDAFSHFQAKGRNTLNNYVYTSTDGQLTQSKMNFMFQTLPEKIFKLTNSRANETILAFDNDISGLYFTAMCLDKLREANLKPRLTNETLYLDDICYSSDGDSQKIVEKLRCCASKKNIVLDLPKNKDWNLELGGTTRRGRKIF